MNACWGRDAEGKRFRKAGIMSVVVETGEVAPGDRIVVHLPEGPHTPLKAV